MHPIRVVLVSLVAAFAYVSTSSAEAVNGVPIFDTPRYAQQENTVFQLIDAGNFQRASAALDQMIVNYPKASRLRVLKARIAMSVGNAEAAVSALLSASSLGHTKMRDVLAERRFGTIADDERIKGLRAQKVEKPSKQNASPSIVQDGIAMVTTENTSWNSDLARLEVAFTYPPTQRSKPFSKAKDGVLSKLNKLVRRGQAAGNLGDLYDNRDDRHSMLSGAKDVQLSVVRYSDTARAAGLHYGLNEAIVFDAVTFGNSSTALQGKTWRSQARHAMTTPFGPVRAWQLYDKNHIYVFPEHRDHDPIKDGGQGDVFPANTPLMLISQGSSGSDRRFLQAIQVALASLKPDVKALLTKTRQIAPTVQQILRRSMADVESIDDYLTPVAHPTVFKKKDVRLDRILSLAQSITADAVPPRAQITVLEEAKRLAPFASPLPEELFTTPDAIARSWRSAERTRRYVLSAASSYDVNNRALKYYWRILRGDPSKVRIEGIKPDASEVSVTIEWHEGVTTPEGLASSRVDIALFAHNGSEFSAPAMFSLDLPAHQKRVYSDDPYDNRPLSIAYLPTRGDLTYSDPVIWPKRGWDDVYDYAESGELEGWTRTYRKGPSAYFTRHGLKVTERDKKGRPKVAEAISYKLDSAKDGRAFLEEKPLNRRFAYSYENEGARFGVPQEIASD